MHEFRHLLTLVLLAALLSACTLASSQPQQAAPTPSLAQEATPALATTGVAEPDYWPTKDWRTSTPEAQGMDSETLARLMATTESLAEQGLGIHGIVLVRHGYIVLEAYFHPFSADIPQNVHSVTESFIGALTGLAIDEGRISGTGHKMLAFFPDRTVANLDERKQAMTVGHLLTMRSGLSWSELGLPASSPYYSSRKMVRSEDWVQFALDLPMVSEPGRTWNYDSGASHLLSAILQQATGQTALEYARSRLFAPLGITQYDWYADPQGTTQGMSGLHLRPRDMAKFGFLYLHGGRWESRQILPAAWVRESIQQHTQTDGSGYGYQIWLYGDGSFAASGSGGQLIWVAPDLDVVAAVTSGLPAERSGLPLDLMNTYVREAVKSDGPLPPNPAGQEHLAAAIQSATQPEPEAVSALPAMAAQISGKVYTLEANSFGWQSISLRFPPEGGSAATLRTCLAQGCLDLAVGLDGVYRITMPAGGQPVAERGRWTSDRSFLLQQVRLGEPSPVEIYLTFKEDTIQASGRDIETGTVESANGRLAATSE